MSTVFLDVVLVVINQLIMGRYGPSKEHKKQVFPYFVNEVANELKQLPDLCVTKSTTVHNTQYSSIGQVQCSTKRVKG